MPVRHGDRRERERVVDLHARDVVLDRVRDVARQRLDVDLARLLGEHAALDDAGRVVGAEQLEHDRGVDRLVHVHAEEVHVHDLAAHRMALEVLDQHRGGLAAVDADVEDRAGVRERVAQDARVDGEVRRLAVAAVDDAGDVARAAQAAGGARTLGRAGGQ